MVRKYKCIKQYDITDCGAACLATISKQYGLKIPGTVITYYSRAKNSSYKVLGFESFNPENSRSK